LTLESQVGKTAGKRDVVKGDIEEIRTNFAEVVTSGHKYTVGEQQAARIRGDLALTSTRISDGEATAGWPAAKPRGRGSG
jgi:hypothetical protein